MPARTIALIVAGSLTAGWLLASLLTPPIARVQVLPERRVTAAAAGPEEAAPYSVQLQLRLRQMPAPPVSRRNPFAFGIGERDRVSDVSPPSSSVDIDAQTERSAAPVRTGPNYTLSGVAVIRTADGPTHTAVLADGTTVHLVKSGETLGGYHIVEVTENSVTLADSAGIQHVIRLKP